MTNDCGLETERGREREKIYIFIRNYMWMARSNVLVFSVVENCDANLCSVHREDASERTQRETNTGKHLFFFLSFSNKLRPPAI